MRNAVIVLMSSLLLSLSSISHSVPIQFNIDGLDSLGSSVVLGIDFIDGDGPSNSLRVTHFSTDGTAGAAVLTGGAISTPQGYELYDSSFFSNVSVEYTGASELSFRLDPTNIPSAPSEFADMMAVYLLDSFGLPSVYTSEPLGTQALMSWSATGIGSGDLLVYTPLFPSNISWSATYLDDEPHQVPEPMILSLLVLGFTVLVLRKGTFKEKQSCASI